jgi:DNA/RNA-binding domain of Phe-tRNA-synthetase-like protein
VTIEDAIQVMQSKVSAASPSAEMKLVRVSDEEARITVLTYSGEMQKITAQTRNVIFTTYAPSRINEEAVTHHLQEIQHNVELIAPNAKVELLKVFGAS